MAPVFITNITIYTGTDFAQTYLLEDYRSNSSLDLTGYTAIAQLKKYSSSEKTADFNISYPNDPCLLYTSPSPRDRTRSRMPSSA